MDQNGPNRTREAATPDPNKVLLDLARLLGAQAAAAQLEALCDAADPEANSPSSTIPQRSYSIEEVAELWGSSTRTVRREIKLGALTATRLGPSGSILRVMEDDLQAYHKERRKTDR